MYNKEWHKEYYKNNRNKILERNKKKYEERNIPKRKKLTIKEFESRYIEKCGDIYNFSNYQGYDKIICAKCKKCGHCRFVLPRTLYGSPNCPVCSGILLSHEKFVDEVNKLYNKTLTILTQYKNAQDKILVKCNICEHIWNVKPSHLIHSNSKCPKCSQKAKTETQLKTHETFILQMNEIHNGCYEIIGKYITAKTKVEIFCKKCNNTWSAIPNSLLSGFGCPFCKSSKGEKKIKNFLEDNHISYLPNYRIKKCKAKMALPFDFAIFDKEKLLMLIEYDGMQHFKPIEWFGGKDKFEIQKKYDNIKNDYCKTNGIYLLRINYLQFKNIEEILTEKLLNN